MGLYAHFVLPRVLEFAMTRPPFMRERPRAVGQAAGEVLEIGFGTGVNLQFYTADVSQLTVIDPVTMLPRRVAQRIAAARVPVDVAQLDAERLPFDAGRFDCVLSTWTLCTIPGVAAALAEVRRVLKPGGKFIFLEHGRSPDARTARWQDRLNRVHGLFTGGCHVNRPIDQLVTDAGLAVRDLERFDLRGLPGYVRHHYLGTAVVA